MRYSLCWTQKHRGGPYRDEISHGEVVCQGSNLFVLALELRAAGYHQFLC